MENITIIQSVGLKTAMLEAADLPLLKPIAQMPQGGVIATPQLPKHNNVFMLIVVSVLGGLLVVYVLDSIEEHKRKQMENNKLNFKIQVFYTELFFKGYDTYKI